MPKAENRMKSAFMKICEAFSVATQTLEHKLAEQKHRKQKARRGEPTGFHAGPNRAVVSYGIGTKPNAGVCGYLMVTKPTRSTIFWPAGPVVKSTNCLAKPVGSPLV